MIVMIVVLNKESKTPLKRVNYLGQLSVKFTKKFTCLNTFRFIRHIQRFGTEDGS